MATMRHRPLLEIFSSQFLKIGQDFMNFEETINNNNIDASQY